MYQNLITIINYIKFICFIHKRIKILDREKIFFIQVKLKKKKVCHQVKIQSIMENISIMISKFLPYTILLSEQ